MLTKNIAIAHGIGDLFIFLTRMEDFFLNNPEYDSVKFWSWCHSPELAKELVSYSGYNTSVYSVEDMTSYLENSLLSPELLEKTRPMFITQNRGGAGVPNYIEFLNNFFPNFEQWIHLTTYNKYKGKFPYSLAVEGKKTEKPYIVIHPFSTAVSTEKKERLWTPLRWGGTINWVCRTFKDYEVLLIGSHKDKIEGRRDFNKPSVAGYKDLRGKISFKESIELVYGASAVIGTNSWPTLLSTWAEIPTCVTWFVQQQLIPFHHPQGYESMEHLTIVKNVGNNPEDLFKFHPTVESMNLAIKGTMEYAERSIS
jgi:hypothetical protein